MISFSANVKRELCRTAPGAKCCALAEMLGALLYANHFSASCIRIVTENPEFAARLPRLLQRGFGLRFDALPEPEAQGKRVLVLEDPEKISHVFTLCGFSAESSLALHVNLALLENDCCRRAFLRGAFLAGGSVTDPAKRYHLEFSTSHRRVCAETGTLLLEMGLTPKQTERKGSSILYFKQSETIEELLARTGYLAAVGALPDGPRCREDLLSFTAWAAGAGRAGLPSLIRAMDAAAANGGLSQSAGGQTRPGCVSIMTVHRSKGLEFPVVFVADTDHKFNQSDAIRPVLTHSRLGVGVMLRAPRAAKRFKTLPYAALAQAIRTETLSEEMRVLYVALTRAQDALIITVPLKKTASSLKLPALCAAAEATGPEAMRSMTSWAGWILTAALLHPDSSALWEYTSFLPHYGLHRAPLAIRVLPLPEETEQPPAPPAPAADPAVVEMLKASFAWRSPREALEKVPAKVSVSAVAHAARPVALERPAFLQKTGMTGAERGTAIHAFMQSVPFDGPAPDLDAEVRRQTDLQLLDPALADKLDLDAVRPFFASAVWRRIRLAKQILREEPFITALPAAEVTPAAGQGRAAAAEVLVQGIADLVLVFDEHAEILDYKTDRSRDAQYYIDEYAAQLRLYRRAFAQRLAVPVTKLTIYSFAIEDEIDVPLA